MQSSQFTVPNEDYVCYKTYSTFCFIRCFKIFSYTVEIYIDTVFYSNYHHSSFIVFSSEKSKTIYVYGHNCHHIQLRWHTTDLQIIMAVFLCRKVWTRLSAGCQIGDITLCLQLTDILAVSQILFETNCRCHVYNFTKNAQLED